MRRIFGVLAFLCLVGMSQTVQAGAYKNFRVAIYVTVGDTKRLADPATFDQGFRPRFVAAPVR